ncbi:MAG: hypothetical protein OEY14_04265 [Myxococcales bacterium]|nr:hypothetical protein [Myxococcales bacterium]
MQEPPDTFEPPSAFGPGSLRLRRIELRSHEWSLPGGSRNARARFGQRRSWILRLEAQGQGGAIGIGEASPLPGYHPDPPARVEAELGDARLEAFELPCGSGLEETLEALERVIPMRSPSARFALQTAVADLLGKLRDQPLHRLLAWDEGSASEPSRSCDDSSEGRDRAAPDARSEGAARLASEAADPLMRAALLGYADAGLERRAREALARGARALKVKAGRDLSKELPPLRALVAAIGESATLRLDLNGQLGGIEPNAALEALASLRLEFLEEPPAALAGRWAARLPLALDESLLASGAERALSGRLRALGARSPFRCTLVLKPMALGGLLRACRVARIGRAAGAELVVSHLLDGPVALAAAAELGLALARPGGPAMGLGDHPGLEPWAAPIAAALAPNALLYHDVPGLGLGADPRVELRRCA